MIDSTYGGPARRRAEFWTALVYANPFHYGPGIHPFLYGKCVFGTIRMSGLDAFIHSTSKYVLDASNYYAVNIYRGL